MDELGEKKLDKNWLAPRQFHSAPAAMTAPAHPRVAHSLRFPVWWELLPLLFGR
jgi:hypothetical protein